MRRPVCALLLLAASCGKITSEGEVCTEAESDRNDPKCGRPLDLAYLTAAVFAPSCGQTQCHSKFHQSGGLVFDNPHDAALSLLAPSSGPLLRFDGVRQDPTRFIDNQRPHLLRWLTEPFPLADEQAVGEEPNSRMPFDAPLASADIELLSVWIREELPTSNPEDMRERRVGASARGAQCNPDAYEGYACTFDSFEGVFRRVKCNDDFNFDTVDIQDCPNDCQLSERCTIDLDVGEQCPSDKVVPAAVCT
jgi:hypothetical protein